MMKLSISLVLLLFTALLSSSAQGAGLKRQRDRHLSHKDKCKRAKKAKSDSLLPYEPFEELDQPATADDCKCPCCDEFTCKAAMDAMNHCFGDDDRRRHLDVEDCSGSRRLETGKTVFLYDYGICPTEGINADPWLCSYKTPTDDSASYGDCCDQFVSGCTRRYERTRRLNEESAAFHERRMEELSDGSGLSVQVESEKPETLDWLKKHVAEMQERLENGDLTREWDDLFAAYFANADDIDMDCEHEEDSVNCIYSSPTKCGRDLIKANAHYHNKVAEQLRTNGSHAIFDSHEAPASCQEEEEEE